MNTYDLDMLKNILDEEDFSVYGIRVDEEIVYSAGDTCYNSRQWLQDRPEDLEETELEYNKGLGCWDCGELSGTCALRVKSVEDLEEMIERSKMYYGKHVTLIGGQYFEYGADEGEVIIRDAEVLAVIK